MKPGLPSGIRIFFLLLLFLSSHILANAQDTSTAAANDATAAAIRDLQQQVRELRDSVNEMKSETAKYRAENQELRKELQSKEADPPAESGYASAAMQYKDASPAPNGTQDPQDLPAGQASSTESQIAALQETTQLLNSKLNDQYQTKVESASKYRVRLSGIVLFNLFSNRGATDNSDVPSYVDGPGQTTSNFGATVRQSEIGLEVFGPRVFGAKSSGNLVADFGGGFPNTWNGVDSGIFRLRTASARLDWDNTSVIAGQDELFISPFAPTTYASLIVPGFNYSGNLWAWTPQLRVEHRFALADGQSIGMQAGILDNLTGEFPADSYFRAPGAGELTGQPAYALRTAWNKPLNGQTLTLGAAGYFGRQNWGNGHHADSWAAMVDWQVPLSRRWAFTGEGYRGRALGGLNASFGQSIVYEGDPGNPATAIQALDTVGGWAQLKFRATEKLEFDGGYGTDNPTTSEVRRGYASEYYTGGSLLAWNRSALGNVIYRPRSNLILSGEYRHMTTYSLDTGSNGGQQVNLMMGILF